MSLARPHTDSRPGHACKCDGHVEDVYLLDSLLSSRLQVSPRNHQELILLGQSTDVIPMFVLLNLYKASGQYPERFFITHDSCAEFVHDPLSFPSTTRSSQHLPSSAMGALGRLVCSALPRNQYIVPVSVVWSLTARYRIYAAPSCLS